MACGPRRNDEADFSQPELINNLLADTLIEVVDTISENHTQTDTMKNSVGGEGAKKPSATNSEMPKPKPDNPSAVDSIKKSYPSKK